MNSKRLDDIKNIINNDVSIKTLECLLTDPNRNINYILLIDEAVKLKNDQFIIKCIKAIHSVNPDEDFLNTNLYKYIIENNKEEIIGLLVKDCKKYKPMIQSYIYNFAK